MKTRNRELMETPQCLIDRAFTEEPDLTWPKLATRMKMCESTLRNLVKGYHCPNEESAQRFGQYFGIDSHEINWPKSPTEQGNGPGLTTGNHPIIERNSVVTFDEDDPSVYYVDGQPFCKAHNTAMYLRNHRPTCDDCC